MIIIDNYLNERNIFEHSFDNLNESFNIMLNEGVGNVITNLKNLLKKFIDFLKRKIIELKNAISSKFSKSKVNTANIKKITAPTVNLNANFNQIEQGIKNSYEKYSAQLNNANTNFLNYLENGDGFDKLEDAAHQMKKKYFDMAYDGEKIEDFIKKSIGYDAVNKKEYKDDEIDKYFKFVDNFKEFYKKATGYGLDAIKDITKQLSNLNNHLSKYQNMEEDVDNLNIKIPVNTYLQYVNGYKERILDANQEISKAINNILSTFIKKDDKQKEN